MLELLDRKLNRIYDLSGYLAAVAILLIAVLVMINIISRAVGAFVPGLTESAGYCMAAAGSLGMAHTLGQGGHIRVAMLLERLRGKGRFAVELWALLLASGLSVYLAVFLVKMVYVSWLFEDRSDGSDEILIWIPQVPAALGFLLFAICLVHASVKSIATGQVMVKDEGSAH